MSIHRQDRGAALIIAMVFIAVLASFAAVMLTESSTRMRAVVGSAKAMQNRLLAETALEAAFEDLNGRGEGNNGNIGITQGWADTQPEGEPGHGLADWFEVKDLANGPVQFGEGHFYWAHVVDLGIDPGPPEYKYQKIIAYGRMEPSRGFDLYEMPVTRYEKIVRARRQEPTHQAFLGTHGVWVGGGDKLIFAGQAGGGPGNADRVHGDVYVDGELACLAASQVDGDSYATGKITGKPPTGTKHPFSPKIDPPDFTKLKDQCDIDVGEAFEGTTWTRPYADCYKSGDTPSNYEQKNIVPTGVLTVPKDNPAHIFAKDSFTSDAMAGVATSADNYQLGDWVSSHDGETIMVYEDGNHVSYYVPGNLWIDPQGYGPTFHLDGSPADDGVQITIVVEGNVYVGDEMYYEGQSYTDDPNDSDPKLNGVAIIAIKARDEFGVPVNQNDDPTDDRPEGYGNVYFGDLNANARPLKVNAILMAEDQFLDKVLKDGAPLEFTLNGLMACGGNLDLIDRGKYKNYAPMTVRHDPRLATPVDEGGIRLPNLPTSGVVSTDLPFVPPWTTVMRWRAR